MPADIGKYNCNCCIYFRKNQSDCFLNLYFLKEVAIDNRLSVAIFAIDNRLSVAIFAIDNR